MNAQAVDKIVSNGGRGPDGSARMLSRWTFEYVRKEDRREACRCRVLNACAGRTKLGYEGEIVRNDLNPEIDADHHLDVIDLAGQFGSGSFDTVIFDPPFDEKQAEAKYDEIHAGDVCAARRGFNELVRPRGRVISFGWNSWGNAVVRCVRARRNRVTPTRADSPRRYRDCRPASSRFARRRAMNGEIRCDECGQAMPDMDRLVDHKTDAHDSYSWVSAGRPLPERFE